MRCFESKMFACNFLFAKPVGPIYEIFKVSFWLYENQPTMKPSQLIAVLFFIFFFMSVSAQQGSLIKTIDSLLMDLSTNKPALDLNLNFRENLTGLRKNMEEEEDQFTGNISFGLNGQEVQRDNFFVISTGVSLSSGTYPFKFELNSGILVQIQNGNFNESVSNLSISFDYNYSEKNLSKQSYVFLTGTNNSYLGIDQRYEIGGGFILNYYSGNRAKKKEFLRNGSLDKKGTSGLTREGEQQLKILNGNTRSYNENTLSFDQGITAVLKSSVLADEEKLEDLRRNRRRFINTIIKKFSTTRLSILGGVNYELEKTGDSLELFNGDLQRKGSFQSTNRPRMVIRPGVDWKGENFSFSSKFYMKMGLFDEFYNEIDDGQNADKRLDYWSEWISSLRFNFTQKISVSILYTLFYDNAPNRQFFDVSTTAEPDIRLFKAENKFKSILLQFNYSL